MNRKRLTLWIAGFGLTIGIAFLIQQRRHSDGTPDKTVEQLFDQRQNQAKTALESPLGIQVLSKNWAEIRRNFTAASQGGQLVRIIRALFIENRMRDFGPDDQEILLSMVLRTLNEDSSLNVETKGIAWAQAERLAAPAPGGANWSVFLQWLKTTPPQNPKYLLAVKKLVGQPTRPQPEALQVLLHHIPQKWSKVQESSLIFTLDEIRNPKTKALVLDHVTKCYSELPPALRSAALIVISRNLGGSVKRSNKIKPMVFKALRSENPSDLEAGLRALPLLHRQTPFTGSEIANIVKSLTTLPETKLSPFSKSKIEEIISILQP